MLVVLCITDNNGYNFSNTYVWNTVVHAHNTRLDLPALFYLHWNASLCGDIGILLVAFVNSNFPTVKNV